MTPFLSCIPCFSCKQLEWHKSGSSKFLESWFCWNYCNSQTYWLSETRLNGCFVIALGGSDLTTAHWRSRESLPRYHGGRRFGQEIRHLCTKWTLKRLTQPCYFLSWPIPYLSSVLKTTSCGLKSFKFTLLKSNRMRCWMQCSLSWQRWCLLRCACASRCILKLFFFNLWMDLKVAQLRWTFPGYRIFVLSSFIALRSFCRRVQIKNS